MNHAAATMTRRTFAISRLLPALAVALLPGATLVPDVNAKKIKNSKATIKKQAENWGKDCGDAGGTATTVTKPGGTTVSCEGGGLGGNTCTFTSRGPRCHQTLTNPPSFPLQDVTAPPTGGYEDPTGGGADPGGGGGIDPGWGNEQPPDGGGVVLTSYHGGQHAKAKHDGQRKHHGRDGKRGKH